jgi:hypothetical protein
MLHRLAAIWQSVPANTGGEPRDASKSHNGQSTRTHCRKELPAKNTRSFHAPLHSEVAIEPAGAGQAEIPAPALVLPEHRKAQLGSSAEANSGC